MNANIIYNTEDDYQLDLFLKHSNQLEKISNTINFFIKELGLELEDIIWCDIGAGNGIQTKKICDEILKKPPEFIIEPREKSINDLETNLEKYNPNFYNMKLEEFVKNESGYHNSCNVAIASHIMYYIMDTPEMIFEWLSSFFKVISPGGVGFIIHQSKTGDMYEFYEKYADDRKKPQPEDFLSNYIEKVKEFTVTIKCKDFDDFLEIGYFLLIDPKRKFYKQETEIKEFLKNRYYDRIENEYIMKQTQKLYQIRIPN